MKCTRETRTHETTNDQENAADDFDHKSCRATWLLALDLFAVDPLSLYAVSAA